MAPLPLDLNQLAARLDTERTQELRANSAAHEAIKLAKRAIFALHRGEIMVASEYLASTRLLLADTADHPERYGPLRAAWEEYAEAHLFFCFVSKTDLLPPAELQSADLVIGGYADLIGEIVRFVTNAVVEGCFEEVERGWVTANKVIEILMSLDLTGGARTKFDQAKQHVRRLETIRYDLAIRTSTYG